MDSPKMYAEGETELRDLIVQNLEACGFLNKIKAELRAGVFLAFEEEGSLRKKIPLFNKKFDEFNKNSNGKLVVSIVREFLEYFNLNFTLSVFDPEIASDSPCFTRSELCNKLKIKDSEFDGPILSALLTLQINSEDDNLHSNMENNTESSPFTSSFKKLETISEDFPTKEKLRNGNSKHIDDNNLSNLSPNFLCNENSEKEKLSIEITNSKKKLHAADPAQKVKSDMTGSLKNEFDSSESNKEEYEKINDLFLNDKTNANNVFQDIINSSNRDHDSFFDEPVPSEKPSFLNLLNDNDPNQNPKDPSQNELNVSSTLCSEKSTLSSLKDLPSLTPKVKDWTLNREFPKTLPSLDGVKPSPVLGKRDDNEVEKDTIDYSDKKDPDAESNEESSDRQINSEESIEEEFEDFSAGLDDLLNSSLSLADDATSDQTVSQVSVVDGVDHIEPCSSIK